jgi:phospholipase/lecithinase/hemolysin
MLSTSRTFVFVLLAGAGFMCTLQANPIDAIYAFGDSLSDVGNVFISTGVPAAPYVNGQFSNGNIWVQDLASDLGLAPLKPSLAGGTDYAVGDAESGTANPGDLLSYQVPAFEAANPGGANPNGLYTIWIGSNDLAAIPPGSSVATVETDIGDIAGNIDTAINDLSSVGAKNFLVVTVPNLGDTPEALAAGAATIAALSELSASFDSVLVNGSGPIPSLSALAAGDSIHISVLNTYALSDAIAANPGLYGFTNVTDPCLVGAVDFSGGTVCATPSKYLYWDPSGHPTAAANLLIADAAQGVVTPEPALTSLIAVGLFGMFLVRRRSWGRYTAIPLAEINRRLCLPKRAQLREITVSESPIFWAGAIRTAA